MSDVLSLLVRLDDVVSSICGVWTTLEEQDMRALRKVHYELVNCRQDMNSYDGRDVMFQVLDLSALLAKIGEVARVVATVKPKLKSPDQDSVIKMATSLGVDLDKQALKDSERVAQAFNGPIRQSIPDDIATDLLKLRLLGDLERSQREITPEAIEALKGRVEAAVDKVRLIMSDEQNAALGKHCSLVLSEHYPRQIRDQLAAAHPIMARLKGKKEKAVQYRKMCDMVKKIQRNVESLRID